VTGIEKTQQQQQQNKQTLPAQHRGSALFVLLQK
jgi:hypothetical protein